MRAKQEQRFEGIGVAPGIARAVAVVRRPEFDEPETYAIAEADIPQERARFEQALVETRRQIVSLQNQVRGSAGAENASIFDAHLLVLGDHTVLDQVFSKLENERVNVESAFYGVFIGYIENLRRIRDPYLRERAIDIQDVARRVLSNLKPGGSKDKPSEASINHPHIVIAQDITPSETVAMDRSIVRGFATEMGAPTSHAAIIARSLGLPAVVALHNLDAVHTGDEVLLDGYNGLLILNPHPDTIAHYQRFESEKGELRQLLEPLIAQRAETTDGFHVTLSCNIEFANESSSVKEVGAEGVGLYRTEFAYLNRDLLPTEQELAEDYGFVANEVRPHNLIIRTLDAGGDKLPGCTHFTAESNPFLGWRGIRVCLEETELFRAQLRAILRSSVSKNVSIMFPLISSVWEFREARKHVELAKDSLRAEGIPFDEEIKVGAMIEIPSAALTADAIAKEADFFSLGTNDLVQYTIAVDRVNERVAKLYAPHHPAVLRLIRHAAEAAQRHGIWIGVCGEMAGDVLSTPLFLGMGITELSVGAGQVLAVKRAIRAVSKADCVALVESIANCDEQEEISRRCRELASARFPELLQ